LGGEKEMTESVTWSGIFYETFCSLWFVWLSRGTNETSVEVEVGNCYRHTGCTFNIISKGAKVEFQGVET
jgi:hypothetical protein